MRPQSQALSFENPPSGRGADPTRIFGRMWDRVNTTGDCWLYEGGSRIKGGYRLAYSHRADDRIFLGLVHRAVWEVVNGPIPVGKEMRHLCNTPNCVLIEHLAIGTRTENEHDKAPYRLPWDRRRTSKAVLS